MPASLRGIGGEVEGENLVELVEGIRLRRIEDILGGRFVEAAINGEAFGGHLQMDWRTVSVTEMY